MKVLDPNDEAIMQAISALKRGKLVGLPTETVYGIGADAFIPDAVQSVFSLKKRPADNPLIVHVADIESASRLTTLWTKKAQVLAEAFCPGPISFVLPKAHHVSDIVTAGRNTVAIRIPRHPVMQRVLRESGLSIAAPSANIFMSLSPTRAEDISEEILQGLACVLDGGSCEVGIESTVIDLTGEVPIILRPGVITKMAIEAVVGEVLLHGGETDEKRSPGMYARHYAPRARAVLVSRITKLRVGLTFGKSESEFQIEMPNDPVRYAAMLYASLKMLDDLGSETIEIESPPMTDEWNAVWDRLNKATTLAD